MAKYEVLKKCYFGEGGQKPRLMYAGEIYESDTLKAKDAPSYLKPTSKADFVAADPKPDAPKSVTGMGYHEMKSFVAENGIEVADYKQPTLEAAIAAWKAKDDADPVDDEAETEVETEVEETEE